MILEEKCPDCPPQPEGEIHCCPVFGFSGSGGCCPTCACRRVILTEDGRAVLDLVRRHLEVEGRLAVSGGTSMRGLLVEKRR